MTEMPETTKSRIVAVLVAIGIVLVAIAYILWKPDEPTYQRKSIEVWLNEMNSGRRNNDLQRRQDAEKAIQSIGLKAFPYIIAHLKTSNSAWSTNYRNLIPKLPSWLRRFLPPPKEEFDWAVGEDAFYALGPPTKPALIIALKDNDASVRCASAGTLGAFAHYIGTDIKDSVPALTDCLQDIDANVRCFSAMTLGYLGPDASSAVPGLIPLLKDPQVPTKTGSVVFVRCAAARTLGKIGPVAKGALPALRPLLNNPDPYDRSVAAIAIWRISSEVTNTLPVLIQVLNQVPEGSEWELVEGLSEMGPRAKAALPALLGQLTMQGTANVPTRFTLDRITNALIKIDPDAAVQAGVSKR
jgi:HEAT repeat protein